MSDIFISYAREDREKAKAIAEVFSQQGWSVWWDRSIPPGRSFDQVIEEALAAAKCVVVLWSKFSVSSDWVKTEAAEGLSRNALVPVRIDELKLPLEFRRLQTVDLAAWKGDAADPELREFLQAVGALLKRDVRQLPPASPPRWKLKPALFALAALVLLAVGWSIYHLQKTGGGSGPSPTPLETRKDAAGKLIPAPEKTSPIPDLMRTPQLGLEFWQGSQQCPMFALDWETFKTRVLLKPAPFEIRCPRFKAAVQICAWSDASIFDQIAPEKKISDVPYFIPGTGMADSTFGTPRLRLANHAHHYFIESRRRPISEQQDSIFFSSVLGENESLTTWPTVYLVVFVDLDQNGEIGSDEFERIVLEFSP